MTDDFDTLLVGVRADVSGFRTQVAQMRAELEGPLASGADRAGRAIEASLNRAIRSGKFGFEDLKKLALGVLGEIAGAAVRSGLQSLGIGGGGGLASIGTSLVGSLFGLPGRATGGPVSPGRAFVVGERGPELFVPTSSGSVAPIAPAGHNVNVAITINASAGESAPLLSRSARQVARAVRGALADA